MTATINLLPRDRLRAIVLRRHITRWAGVISLCASVALPMSLTLREGVNPSLVEQVRRAEENLAVLQQQRAALSKEYASLQQELRGEMILADQVRWVPLIERVLEIVGDDAALDRLAIERTQNSDGQSKYHLSLRGLVREQSDALDLTVRLETLGIFERVILEESARRETVIGELVSFRIRTTLRGGGA